MWKVQALNINLTQFQRKVLLFWPTSAGHELKSDVIELLLGVPQPEDEADGNTGVGCSRILRQVKYGKPVVIPSTLKTGGYKTERQNCLLSNIYLSSGDM